MRVASSLVAWLGVSKAFLPFSELYCSLLYSCHSKPVGNASTQRRIVCRARQFTLPSSKVNVPPLDGRSADRSPSFDHSSGNSSILTLVSHLSCTSQDIPIPFCGAFACKLHYGGIKELEVRCHIPRNPIVPSCGRTFLFRGRSPSVA